MTVVALASDSTTDICRLNVSATFVKGKAVWIRFVAVKDGIDTSTPTPALPRLATSYSQIFAGVTLGGNVWSFRVQLLDRKHQLPAEAQTDTEEWVSTTSCPRNPTELATYPL